jgi:hypothetical protein
MGVAKVDMVIVSRLTGSIEAAMFPFQYCWEKPPHASPEPQPAQTVERPGDQRGLRVNHKVTPSQNRKRLSKHNEPMSRETALAVTRSVSYEDEAANS